MVNNIGSTTLTLPTTIGGHLGITDPINRGTVTMISGELTTGAIITDTDGTVAVVETYIINLRTGTYTYTVRTITTKTEFDVQSILQRSY